ncbi:hypothetical protein E5163_00950 [Marinicauda algicola]|uniref:Uncharacterized protein n=1 Tax=Marinicauda algicola TaxID=2029849 RepID=A0A4S2H3B7_9PROT|nr:hypothetical protein [Marinicauda algicola]TGY89742.1 hypothetical protein E5163_00950 [Marinicauda algicola]
MSFVYQFIGIVLILAGLPLFWTPIPVGLIMIATGLALLISNSTFVRTRVQMARYDNPGFDRWLVRAKRYVPHPFDRVLERTEAQRHNPPARRE